MSFPGYMSLGASLLRAATAAEVSDTTLGKEPSKFLKLGTRVSDDEGNEYVWVQAQGAIAVTDIIAIDGGYDCPPLSGAGIAWAVAIVAIEDNGQGFVQVKGVVDATEKTDVADNDELARLTDSSGDLLAMVAVATDGSEAPGSFDIFAIALEADTGGVGSIYIF